MDNPIYFKEREIWNCNLGENIGREQNGSGKQLLRPVLIIKKYDNELFFGIPLSTKNKMLPFYYSLGFIKDRDAFAIIIQGRSMSTKRLKYRIDTLNKTTFDKIKLAAKEYTFGS